MTLSNGSPKFIICSVYSQYCQRICYLVQVWFTSRTWCASFGRRRKLLKWQTLCLFAYTRQTSCLFVSTLSRLSLVRQNLSGTFNFLNLITFVHDVKNWECSFIRLCRQEVVGRVHHVFEKWSPQHVTNLSRMECFTSHRLQVEGTNDV